jgi:hypothetical protein
MPSLLRRALTDRAALAVFAFLAVTWLLPRVVSAVGPLRWLLPVTWVLVLPSYLIVLFVYDSFLEVPATHIADALPVAGEYVWEAGLFVVFYAFAVLAVAAGRWLATRYRPDAGEVRTVLAGAFVLLGAVLLVGGAVTAVTVPVTEAHVCWASESSSGGASQGCFTETAFNTFPYWSMAGGLALAALGGLVLTGTAPIRERLAAA